MKNSILRYILEILLVSFVIFISVPLWNKSIDNVNNIKEHIRDNGLELIATLDENDDKKLKAISSGVYNVINNSNYNTSGVLLYKLNKSSTINPDCLDLMINGKRYDLKYYYHSEDENNYIYLINTFNLNGKERKIYNIKLIVKEDMYMKTLGKKYKYSISVENNSNLV